MAQKEEITFELLVYSGTRWEAQGSYGAHEQRTAIADGKSLARVSTVKGVKVVKEFFDNKSNVSRSLTVFEHTPSAPSSKTRPTPQRRTAKPSKASMSGDVREGGGDDQPKGTSFLSVVVKILLSIAISLATAGVVMQMAVFALKGVRTIGMINKGDFLVIIFILVFVITVLALITRILINLKRLSPIIKPRPAARPVPVKRKRNTRLTPSADEFKSDLQPIKEDEEKEKVEEEKNKAEQEALLAEEEARKKVEEEAAKKAEVDALSEVITMNAFTQDAFEVLQGDNTKQDAHTVFGLVLFLVGAVQTLRHQNKLPDDVVNTVAAQALGNLGLSPERSKHFLEHTDEYLISNARYSEMFQTGRGAMGEYLEHDTGPRVALSEALSDWDKPKPKSETGTQPVTVLFTDIAGSTAMTQKLGDAGAQEVVRAHNRIVREAIQGFTGKEIKHTGDGIMASFPSASAGVDAALEMQKRTKSHNASDPNHPLGLKIGLNTGEPISEDDDLFGSTVQLAARIVDKAAEGQVLVSSSVHGLCQGKQMKFERFADLDMKGFDEAVTVYVALWDPDAPATVKPQPKPIQTPQPAAQPVVKPVVEAVVAAQTPETPQDLGVTQPKATPSSLARKLETAKPLTVPSVPVKPLTPKPEAKVPEKTPKPQPLTSSVGAQKPTTAPTTQVKEKPKDTEKAKNVAKNGVQTASSDDK